MRILDTAIRQRNAMREIDHRPWPLPRGPWLIAQTWEHVVFAHWRVPAAVLRPHLPPGLEVEEHDGSAWLGVSPFRVDAVRLHGTLPVPWVSSFAELNVRTYVSRDGKPGVWFFSLDTPSRSAVEGARLVYRLPWHQARVEIDERAGRIEVQSAREAGKAFSARVSPRGRPAPAEPGSLEHFLLERYCLYAADGTRLLRSELHHRPWPVQPAQGVVDLNTMAPDGVELPDEPPVLHYARLQDALAWPPERL